MTRTVLIGDESALARMLRLLLHEAGTGVISVRLPEDVIGVLGERKPELIVFPTEMDQRSRLSLVRSWRAISPSTRTLEISEEPLSPHTVLREGVCLASLRIPFRPERLVEMVHRLLGPAAPADGLGRWSGP